MWSLERHRKRREKNPPTRSGRYHELTMTVVPDTTQRRIVCGRTDGRRAPQRDTRERERRNRSHESCCGEETRAKLASERRRGRRRRPPKEKKGRKEGAFLSLLQTNAHLNAVLSPTMFLRTFGTHCTKCELFNCVT
jgi:hypothetical protein